MVNNNSDPIYYVCRICSHTFRTRNFKHHEFRRTEFPIPHPIGTWPTNYTGLCDDCLVNGEAKLKEMYAESSTEGL